MTGFYMQDWELRMIENKTQAAFENAHKREGFEVEAYQFGDGILNLEIHTYNEQGFLIKTIYERFQSYDEFNDYLKTI